MRQDVWYAIAAVVFILGVSYFMLRAEGEQKTGSIQRVACVCETSSPAPVGPAWTPCIWQNAPMPRYPSCLFDDHSKLEALPAPVNFPACTPRSWLPIPPDLFNPLSPWPVHVHHPALRLFKQYHGPVDGHYMTDWLGIRTAYVHECAGGPGQLFSYMPYVPSRRYQCERHCRIVNEGVRAAPGELPLMDDEYPEWADMLSSVIRTREDYVVVELGARLGTWGVRALAAHAQFWGAGKASLIAVEDWSYYVDWTQHHINVNGFTNRSLVVKATVGSKPGEFDLASIFRRVDHVDYLDVDVQHAELPFFLNASRALLARVVHVHVGTHTAEIHVRMRKFFSEELRWRKVLDLDFNSTRFCEDGLVNSRQTKRECWTQTPYGPLYVRDGLLGYVNPGKVPENDMYPSF